MGSFHFVVGFSGEEKRIAFFFRLLFFEKVLLTGLFAL
jgi:hypothetical protein